MGFVGDFFDSIFGFIGDVLNTIGSAVASVLNAIGNVLTSAISSVVSFLQAHWIEITLVGVTLAGWYFSAFGAEFMAMLNTGYISGWAAVEAFGYSLYQYVGSLAAAIHLKTVASIHTIAFVLSADYRNLTGQLYGQIAQVSQALGLGTEALYLLYRNTRTLVLDVSTSLGERFDLAEITWLKTFADYLDKTRHKFQEYRNNPGNLINDLVEIIEKPILDAKGSAMAGFWSALEGASKLTLSIMQTVKTIDNDLRRLIADLPESIRNQVKPWFDSVHNELNSFINLVYVPAKTILDESIKQLAADRDELKERTKGILERMRRPGQYLKEIKTLPPDEQTEDLVSLYELANEVEYQRLKELNEALPDEIATMFTPPPMPAKKIVEVEIEASKISPVPKTEFNAPRLIPKWFQGEY